MRGLFETYGHYEAIRSLKLASLRRLKPNHFLISDSLEEDAEGDTYPSLTLIIPPYGERGELWQFICDHELQNTRFHVFELLKDARNILGYDHEYSDQWEALE